VEEWSRIDQPEHYRFGQADGLGFHSDQSEHYRFGPAVGSGFHTDQLEHYRTGLDLETGELFLRHPEYTTMSRRPGIAFNWFRKFSTDVFPDDFLVF